MSRRKNKPDRSARPPSPDARGPANGTTPADPKVQATLDEMMRLARQGVDPARLIDMALTLTKEQAKHLAPGQVVIKVANLAAELLQLRHMERGLAEYEFALEYGRAHDALDVHVHGTILNSIGLAKHALKDPDGAAAAHREALELRERVLGPDALPAALSRANLARALLDKGAFKEADVLYERAIRVFRDRHAPPDDMAYALQSQADCTRQLGDDARSQRLYERARELWIRVQGKDCHPAAVCSLWIGHFRLRVGDAAGARSMLEHAEKVFRAGRESTVPQLAATLMRYGEALRVLGEPDKAQRAFAQGLIYAHTAAPLIGSGPALVCQSGLSAIAQAQGRLTAARAYLEEWLGRLEERVGPDAEQVADMLSHLGLVALLEHDGPGARPFLERALGIYERTQGQQGHLVGNLLTSIGHACRASGVTRDARAAFERAVAVLEARSDSVPTDLAFALCHLAELRFVEDAEEAQAYLVTGSRPAGVGGKSSEWRFMAGTC